MATDTVVVKAEIVEARKAIREAFSVVGRDDATTAERTAVARDLLRKVAALGMLSHEHPAEWARDSAALATGTRFGEHAARIAKAVREQAEVYARAARATQRASRQGAEPTGRGEVEPSKGAFLVRVDPKTMVKLDRKVRMIDGVPEPGDPKPTLSNVVMILEEDASLKGRIRFNLFNQVVEIDGGEKTDDLDTHVAIALDRTYGVEVPTEKVREALAYVARKASYDPLIEYLESVKWDGVPRIGQVFIDYFAVDVPVVEADGEMVRDGSLVSAIERCFFIGAVARAFKPGCKMDTMPIFVGAGGKGKSQTVAALCPNPAWFCDTPIDLRDKDRFQSLDGVWIYEQAELDTLSTSNLNRAKGFMSSAVDKYRRPYDRTPGRHPRRTVSMGSTNDAEFGKDRRFHPLDVRDDGEMRPGEVAAIRDQLWAEAVELYRAGVPWNLDMSESVRLMDHAEKYRVVLPWEERVHAFLARENEAFRSRAIQAVPHFSIGQVTTYLSLPDDKAASPGIMQKIGDILTKAGCKKGRPRYEGGRPSRWFLPGVDPGAWT